MNFGHLRSHGLVSCREKRIRLVKLKANSNIDRWTLVINDNDGPGKISCLSAWCGTRSLSEHVKIANYQISGPVCAVMDLNSLMDTVKKLLPTLFSGTLGTIIFGQHICWI
jgi:hypothetical protein